MNSTDGAANPARLGAILILGILAGMIAATALLVQGGGWLMALAAYSGTGSLTVVGAAIAKATWCSRQRVGAPAWAARG